MVELGPHSKSFPLGAQPGALADIAQRGWNVLANNLAFPLAVLRRSALMHNLRWMQDFAQRKGIHLAPHGKTSMSPELFAMQLAAGAWGLSFATVFQLGVGVAAGVRRAIIANQVLGAADLAGLQHLLRQHADLRVWFLVDSIAQLRLIEAWADTQAECQPFDVLLEMGIPGQRTGCRTLDEALALAQALAASKSVRLGGVECYEGHAAVCDPELDPVAVSALVRRVLEVARACDARDWFAPGEIIVSAGGSAVFDLVLPLLQAQGLSQPVCGVLRSGCYLTHDHGTYKRLGTLVNQRLAQHGLNGRPWGCGSGLEAALQIGAAVQSCPESGLAILNAGKRDLSYDMGLPTPIAWCPATATEAADVSPVPAHWRITALNDQHAYLSTMPVEGMAGGAQLQVGDRVVLGISHPCTTFDKWRWMPLVNDGLQVTGAITTRF